MPIQTNTPQDSTPGINASPSAPWRVAAVSVLPEYKLAVTFRDGSSATLDLSSLREAKDVGIYGALADPKFFEQATLALGAITWPNGADLDPAWIYEETRNRKLWSVPF